MPLISTRGSTSARGLGFLSSEYINNTAYGTPVAGYHVWLDAAYDSSFTYSSGSTVSQWTDRSGNAFAFTNATAANQPIRTNRLNGRKTLTFDGAGGSASSDWLQSTAAASTWNYLHNGNGATVFIVFKNTDATGDTNGLMSTAGISGPGFTVRVDETTSPNQIDASIWMSGGSGGYLQNNNRNLLNSSGFNVLTLVSDPNNATDANKLIQYHGLDAGLGATFVYTWTTSTANAYQTLLIGAESTGLTTSTYKWGGDIAEIIIYQSILSSTDRNTNINYLKSKWGI